MPHHFGLISCMVSQIPENEDSVSGKDPGLFELDIVNERVPERMSSTVSCSSSKDDDDIVSSYEKALNFVRLSIAPKIMKSWQEMDGMQIKSPRALSADQDRFSQR